MMKEYHQGMQVPYVVAPLGSAAGPLMLEAYRHLAAAGVDVAFDSRLIPFAQKSDDWEDSGTVAIVCGDCNAPARTVTIHSTERYELRRKDIDVRKAWELLIEDAGKEVPAYREAEAAPAPITPMSPAEPAPAESAPDESIHSWALDDNSWQSEISGQRLQTQRMAKAEWKLPKQCNFHVRVGDRIYRGSKEAALAHGWLLSNGGPNPKLSQAMKMGAREHNGFSIAYADPLLDAIRTGKTREEYMGAHEAAKASPIATVKSTQGSVIDSAPVRAAMKAVGDEAPEGEEVATIVVQADGSLGLDRELDYATAARVLEFFRDAAEKGGKVAI